MPEVMAQEVCLVLETINRAWLGENPEVVRAALASCFHPDMVIKDAALKTVARGREACIRSYLDFIKLARVSSFQQAAPDVHLSAECAVASYYWRIVYLLAGQTYDEHGSDIFVFARTEGKWLALWRAMLTRPG